MSIKSRGWEIEGKFDLEGVSRSYSMSLTREHIQEALSVAYISAVAAKAGFDCGNPRRYDYGIDLQISPIIVDEYGDNIPNGIPLVVQAKASHVFNESVDSITYDLKTRNYNILASNNKGLPYILISYCMPSEDAEWMNICENNTILKHKGYWKSLRGEPRSKNRQTVRITIPKTQIFNGSNLTSIMNAIQESDHL